MTHPGEGFTNQLTCRFPATESVCEMIFLSCVHSLADTMVTTIQFRSGCGSTDPIVTEVNGKTSLTSVGAGLSPVLWKNQAAGLILLEGISVCIVERADGAS